MSCDEHYLFFTNQISTLPDCSKKFGLMKVASSFLCSASVETLADSSSNTILLNNLDKCNTLLDDQTPGCVDNYASAIDLLLTSKQQTRNCGQWKSELSIHCKEFIDSLESDKNLQCSQPDSKYTCKSYNIDPADVKFIIQKQQSGDRITTSNILKSDRHIPGQSTRNLNKEIPKVQKDTLCLHGDKVNVNQIPEINTRKVVSQDSNKIVNIAKHGASSQNLQPSFGFKTARAELVFQNKKGNASKQPANVLLPIAQKRSLGARGAPSKFVSPMIMNDQSINTHSDETELIEDERLKHIDPKMVELIRSEIIDNSTAIGWDDIAGLEFAKTVIQEAVVWPLLRPDIFTGLRKPPRGILFFGPPGTGKTLIGKCIASQCRATFFSISASSLTSKWLGDGEKMVRALFAVARCHQPSVVFIDEIDSLLTQRSDSEHESTRRIKTEFLVQLDGAATAGDDRLLLIGATNRPQELDEAARRRLVKRLYIPLPDNNARCQIIRRLMMTERHTLSDSDINEVGQLAQGFSGADMQSLCSEAALQPIRAVPMSQIASIQTHQVRPVTLDDFKFALKRVRPSVSGADLHQYEEWDQTYGSGTMSYTSK